MQEESPGRSRGKKHRTGDLTQVRPHFANKTIGTFIKCGPRILPFPPDGKPSYLHKDSGLLKFSRDLPTVTWILLPVFCIQAWGITDSVEAAEECVASWHQSPGHWKAVSSGQAVYAYDMKQGSNGVWYATGILATP